MDFSLFSGKIGVENLLLIAVGLLHLTMFWMRRKDASIYHRLFLHFWEGLFFVFYGFLYDIYRYSFALTFMLTDLGWRNVSTWRMVILFFFLVPVYATLTRDVLMYAYRKRTTRHTAHHTAPVSPDSWWRSLTLAFWHKHATTTEEAVSLDREILSRVTMIEETISERVWQELKDLRQMVQTERGGAPLPPRSPGQQ